MAVLNAIFMAIVQAIAFVLPTSEIGHIAIFNNFAGRQQNSFSQINGWIEIGIALGLIIALYKPFLSLLRELISTISELITDKNKLKAPTMSRKFFYMTLIPLLFPFLWLIPTGNSNNLYGTLSSLNFDKTVFSEGLFFLLTSALLLLLYIVTNKNIKQNKFNNVSVASSVVFGLLMLITVPVGGLSYVVMSMTLLTVFGVSTKIAFRYTFVLAVPMLLISGIVNICVSINVQNALSVIIGLVVSSLITFFAVKVSKYIFVKNYNDKFALYNVSIGVITTFIGIIQFFVK